MAITKAQFEAVSGAPAIPAEVTDVRQYAVELLQTATTAEALENLGKPRDEQTNEFSWRIGEDGILDGRLNIRVQLAGIRVVS